MKTTAKRAPVAAAGAQRHAAKARRKTAQRACNHIARELERAYDGGYALNCFRAGELQPLGMDLLHPLRLAKLRKDPRWRPPKGALEALCIFAMLIWRWRLPRRHARGGERGGSLLATNDIMAALGGCSPDQWARHARPFLEYFELLQGVPTTRAGQHIGRDGQRITAPEGRTLYVPGDALYELLGRRERRIERSRRALIAVARRQLADRDRKKSDPKDLVLSSPTENIRTSRARGRMPLAHQFVRSYQRPRRSVRPTAASTVQATPPPPPSMSPATAVDESARDNQRLATKGAGAGAAVGDEVKTPLERAPVAQQATPAPPEGSPSPPPSDAGAGASPPPADGDERAALKELLAGLYARFGDVMRAPPPPPPSRPRAPLPGHGLGELMRAAERRARRASEEPPPETGAAPPFGALFGGERRSADERADNERRRQEALERARREAESLDDDPPPRGDDDQGRR